MEDNKKNEIEDISEDIEEISEDTNKILRRIDKNIRNQEKLLKLIAATKKSIWILLIVWILQFIIDKLVMWFMIGYRFGL